MDPGVETRGVAERREVTPAADERLLDGVLSAISVPENKSGDRIEAIDHGGH
jgi:hypothetical protein